MTKDPFRYFRIEARELLDGLSQGVLRLERGELDAELVPRLLRYAHTFKGAARVVQQARIAERAHELEGMLAPLRGATSPPPRDACAAMIATLDDIAALLAAIDGPPASPAAPASAPAAPTPDPLQTMRVETEELDALVRGVTLAGVEVGAARRAIEGLDRLETLARLLSDAGTPLGSIRARAAADELRGGLTRLRRELGARLDRTEVELAGVREGAHHLRLVPVRSIVPVLTRAARDAAQALGRRVELRVTGADARLDVSALGALRDALLHVVRNAVVHGIEPPDARAAAGKPPAGTITIEVARHGDQLALTCADDGRGFDVTAIRAAATARGVGLAPTATDDDVLRTLLAGGVTTAAGQLSQLSGRGIGLDVVAQTAAQLGGTVRLGSARGVGARIELRFPVSIASVPALLVEIAGGVVGFPLDAVRRVVRVAPGDVIRTAERDAILLDGAVVPLLALARALRRGDEATTARVASVVVLEEGGVTAGAIVRRVIGPSTIVVRRLATVVAADPIVAGAALDPEGVPILVLDAAAVIDAAARARVARDTAVAPRPPLLVIDDSLTTRMLEQSILESAGYQVDLATSGEEGLARARARRYGVIIVDVEMPGMDGFEFVATTRADPDLRQIPAILVTSRNAPEDQRRGAEVGAHAYMVKSEFDQGRLLHLIRDLIG